MCGHYERWVDDRANSCVTIVTCRTTVPDEEPLRAFRHTGFSSKGWAPRCHKPKLGVQYRRGNIANARVRNYMTTEEPALRAIQRLASNQRAANAYCAHVNSGAGWPAPDCGPWLESHGTQTVPTRVPRSSALRTAQEYRFFDGPNLHPVRPIHECDGH